MLLSELRSCIPNIQETFELFESDQASWIKK